MLLTDSDCLEKKKSKKKHSTQGLVTTPKLFRMFRLSCPTSPENFMKIRWSVFRDVADKQINKPTDIKKNMIFMR